MKCQWCGKRRSDCKLAPTQRLDARPIGEICDRCNRDVAGPARAVIESCTLRPGDVVISRDAAVGRIAEMHFASQGNVPYAIVELDNGQRDCTPLDNLALVQATSLPVTVFCGVSLTVDHAAAVAAPIAFSEAA